MLMKLVFPYTMGKFIEPISKCMNTLEVLDIDTVIKLFRLCGTDVLFMQDKYYGPTVPYSNIMLAQDDVEDTIPDEASTFITVFKTPWIDLVFNYLSDTFGFDIIYKTKMVVPLAVSEDCYNDSDLLDTVTLFDEQGKLSIDIIAKHVFECKNQMTSELFDPSTLYWGNTFGYTIAPMSAVSKFDTVRRPIVFDFEYAEI